MVNFYLKLIALAGVILDIMYEGKSNTIAQTNKAPAFNNIIVPKSK